MEEAKENVEVMRVHICQSTKIPLFHIKVGREELYLTSDQTKKTYPS